MEGATVVREVLPVSSTATVQGGPAYSVVLSAGTVRALDAVTSGVADRLRGLGEDRLADAVCLLSLRLGSRRYWLAVVCHHPGQVPRAPTEWFVGGAGCDGAAHPGTRLAFALPAGLPDNERSADLRFPLHVAMNLRTLGRGRRRRSVPDPAVGLHRAARQPHRRARAGHRLPGGGSAPVGRTARRRLLLPESDPGGSRCSGQRSTCCQPGSRRPRRSVLAGCAPCAHRRRHRTVPLRPRQAGDRKRLLRPAGVPHRPVRPGQRRADGPPLRTAARGERRAAPRGPHRTARPRPGASSRARRDDDPSSGRTAGEPPQAKAVHLRPPG